MNEFVVSPSIDFHKPAAVRLGEELDVPSRGIHRVCIQVRTEVPAQAHLRRGDREPTVAEIVACRDRLRADRPQEGVDGRAQAERVDRRRRASDEPPQASVLRTSEFGGRGAHEDDGIPVPLEIGGDTAPQVFDETHAQDDWRRRARAESGLVVERHIPGGDRDAKGLCGRTNPPDGFPERPESIRLLRVPEVEAVREGMRDRADRCEIPANLVHRGRAADERIEDDPVEIIMDETDRQGVDEALEFSGGEEALRQALKVLKPAGSIHILGFYAKPVTIDIDSLTTKGASIHGIHGRRMFEDWYRMQGLFKSGIDLMPVITHKFPLDDVAEAMELMRSGDCGKVALLP